MSVFQLFKGQTTITNPDKDRSLPGKKRRRAVRKARATERNLYAKAAPKVAVHGLQELYGMLLGDLRRIAADFEIAGRSKMGKSELVEAIYQSEENQR